MKRTLIIIFTFFSIACGTSKHFEIPVPTQSDADRMSQKFPGITLADLNNGKMKFEQNCSRCHNLKNPRSRNEKKWRATVPRMAGKAKKKFNEDVINSETQEAILKYLISQGK